jgi:hypothetical protein
MSSRRISYRSHCGPGIRIDHHSILPTHGRVNIVAPGRDPWTPEIAVKCSRNGRSANVAPAGKKEKKKERDKYRSCYRIWCACRQPFCHSEEKY